MRKCSRCKGRGIQYVANGADDVDKEECDHCNGGYVSYNFKSDHCIPLGTYGLDEAYRLREKFNSEKKRNNAQSKHWYIKLRGRGVRSSRTDWKNHKFYRDFLPLKYAQRIAVYLEKKEIV